MAQDGDEESANFGLIVATDGAQSLALAVRTSAGSLQSETPRTSRAGAPSSGTKAGDGRSSETTDLDSSVEYGTPRASFDHEHIDSAQRHCFRWFKGTPRFDGTVPAQPFDRADPDTGDGFDTKHVQVYDDPIAQCIEQAFTNYCEARGPPCFTHVMRSHAYGTMEEQIDFVDWTVTCSVTSGARHFTGKAPRRSDSNRLGPASLKTCVVTLHREVEGVPLCTEEVDLVPADTGSNQQQQELGIHNRRQQPQTQEGVVDDLKLWCRLNQNGELETIPGACKDGYGGLDSSCVHNAAPHFLVAVQLGKREWGVRLLPQRDDGTVGCAAHMRWELRNEKLYSLAISDHLSAHSSADAYVSTTSSPLPPATATEIVDSDDLAARVSGTKLSDGQVSEVELLSLEIHAPHVYGAEHAPTPVPVRWTRGHKSHLEDEQKQKPEGVLRLIPTSVNNSSSSSDKNAVFHQSSKTASSASSTSSLEAMTEPPDSDLSVLNRWTVVDENDGEEVLRANVHTPHHISLIQCSALYWNPVLL